MGSAKDLARVTRLMRALTSVGLFVALVGGCSRHERLVWSACEPLTSVAAASKGFETEDAVTSDLGELSTPPQRWERAELIQDGHTLLVLDDVSLSWSSFDSRLATFASLPIAGGTRAEIASRIAPMLEGLERSGFVVIHGEKESLVSSDAAKPLRMIALQRDDTRVWISIELGDSLETFWYQVGAYSVALCRSPDMIRWLEANDPLYRRP